jgi:hypothetical protein
MIVFTDKAFAEGDVVSVQIQVKKIEVEGKLVYSLVLAIYLRGVTNPAIIERDSPLETIDDYIYTLYSLSDYYNSDRPSPDFDRTREKLLTKYNLLEGKEGKEE